MTRVRLPPDPASKNCITTIIDSRGADATLATAAVSHGLLPAVSSSASLTEMGRSSGGRFGQPQGGARANPGQGGGGPSHQSDLLQQSGTGGYGERSISSEQPESSAIGIGRTAASSALLAGGIGDVDCIILVYDLDRMETFYRLEQHWLPLIERCYSGQVSGMHAGFFSLFQTSCLPLIYLCLHCSLHPFR